MRLLKLALKRETAIPMLALGFTSGASVLLVLARILATGQYRYGFLVWNLFLAWLPLAFALLACDEFRAPARSKWRFLSFAGAWLLFFPNAPYIFTDVIHATTQYFQSFWIGLTLILLYAVTGLVLGFVSLYLMQTLVVAAFGRLTGWLFIAGVTALSGVGIYLGRFLRFNSWDIVFKPVQLYHGLGTLTAGPFARPGSVAFSALFGIFLFLSYLMLYALTHLKPAQPLPLRAVAGAAGSAT